MKTGKIGCDTFEDEINFAVEHVALAHQRPVAAFFFKGGQIGFGLAGKPDHSKDLHLKTQIARVHICMISADVAAFFQSSHTPQTRRRRDADTFGKLDIRHATICLQFGQDLAINRIKPHTCHKSPGEFSIVITPAVPDAILFRRSAII